MRFAAAEISVDGIEVDVNLPANWIESKLDTDELRVTTEGHVTGRISRSGAYDMVVRCRVQAAVETPCVRCLEPAKMAVESELSLLLEPTARSNRRTAAASNSEHQFSAAEAELDVYDGECVVLDDFVREVILLELPNFPLCSESCPGMRPGPEMALHESTPGSAVDPRLAPLGTFRKPVEGAPVTVEDLVAAAAERSAALGRKPILRSNRRGNKRKKNKK